MLGYLKSFISANNNRIELLALYEGLKIMEEHNFTPMEVNIDFTEIIKMLKEGNYIYSDIIDDFKSKLRRLGSPVVRHGNREQNMMANALAELGAISTTFEWTKLLAVPPVCA